MPMGLSLRLFFCFYFFVLVHNYMLEVGISESFDPQFSTLDLIYFE